MNQNLTIIITILAVFLVGVINAETVNAGEDIYVCYNEGYAEMLGGNPTMLGDTGQYMYEWSADSFFVGQNGYGIGDYVDDIYSPNPILTWVAGNSCTFYVDVYDEDSVWVGRDTVTAYESTISEILGTVTKNIEEGDSVYFDEGINLAGGFPPYQYLWDPSSSLSRADTNVGFWAFPTVTTWYHVTLTDSIGCTQRSLNPTLIVNVSPLSINESYMDQDLKVYPNPTSQFLNFTNIKETVQIQVYSTDGKMLLNYGQVTGGSELPLDISSLPTGIYLLKIYTVDSVQNVKINKI